ncbi:DUF3095 domain-containing protein [Polaribacter aestuariivivens]|uniref:DUF3095 domain-containing protein n=1 Tax=Polaribacter aestuariivivens TaxID=2304626 RepID=A0A5S3N3P8_9FLAO|nr:DUF3095 domain-containing protein [Polaribacter aestuariivivens]TMM29863.1 DUF3095 domain-containing protein [Polaribacter aestuariivivens]
MANNTNFYKNLKFHNIALRELLKSENLFNSVPNNWTVVVTDIVNSTSVIRKGKHNDVNLVATGSIITVLNKIKTIDSNITIPYFFGGDGATFLVPDEILSSVFLALENYAKHVKNNFNFTLRVGKIAVSEVYKSEATIRIAKLKLNPFLVTPVVIGNGLKYAEKFIKDNFNTSLEVSYKNVPIDLEGMECRWDEIEPISEDKKVICLLVMCKNETKQAEIFTKIMDEIDYIFGELSERAPITTVKLKLNTSLAKIKHEMYARLGKLDRKYLIKNWLITNFGKLYFKYFKAGKEYLFKVSQLSDTIMLDGSINTVFSGNENQINKLKLLLDSLESDREIIYGIHATYASIMSCYIEDREEKHIHFVDGTEGGYTSAAGELKRKLNAHTAYFWK